MQLQTQIGTPYYMAPGSINDKSQTVVPVTDLTSSLLMTRNSL